LIQYTFTFWLMLLASATAAVAIGLSVILTLKKWSGPFHRTVAGAVAAIGVVQIANISGFMDNAYTLEWRRLGFIFELFFVAALQYVGTTFLKKPEGTTDESGARWRAHAVSIIALGFAVVASSPLIYFPAITEDGRAVVALGALGRVAYFFIVLSLALGLAQLEHILRLMPDPTRYKIKYVLIGLGALAGYCIYQASQLLMVPVWKSDFVLAGAIASLISLVLITFGFGRLRLRDVRATVYISPQILYGSITFLVIGIYLLGVGLVGEVIRHSGEAWGVGLSILVVFVAVVALVVVLFSRAARASTRQFIARHFYRSKYDYRAKWLEVTEAFGVCVSDEDILDRLLQLLARTFGADRLAIWLQYEADGLYHQVRSVNTEPSPRPLGPGHPVIDRLIESDEPIDLGHVRRMPKGLDPTDPLFAGAILYAPIRAERHLIGFVSMSRQFRQAYGHDDFDLLRAITYHAGMLLSLNRLSEEKRATSELEALHRFSAFCLHDLKNLAAKLSLVVQNAEVQGNNQAFRESAMRTVSATVAKMMELIAKLSLRSAHPGNLELVNVEEAIADVVGSFNGELKIKVQRSAEQISSIRFVPEQLEQVLLNVMLNAQQGLAQIEQPQSEKPDVSIFTEQRNSAVVITVRDRGPGISPEKLPSLFRPFKSTKAGGFGLGLYQCKRIVEEHGGNIEISSESGKGTEVRITLPIAAGKE
jgi:putative PEP-CTERM system histidine kinase